MGRNYAYERGMRFERRFKKRLEELGWFCMRNKQRTFPDGFAAKDGWSFYFENKNRKTMPVNKLFLLDKKERDNAFGIIGTTQHPFFLIYNANRKIRILAVGGKG